MAKLKPKKCVKRVCEAFLAAGGGVRQRLTAQVDGWD
jgi:hypothetical protein